MGIKWSHVWNTSHTFLSKDELKKYNIYDQFQFVYLVSDQKNGVNEYSKSFSHLFFLPIMEALMKTNGVILNYSQLDRCKINMQTKKVVDNPHSYNLPHVDNDLDFKGLTAIYYVNDSDGDTYFFEGSDNISNQDTIDFFSNLKVVKKVSPKKGRLVIFDSNIIHAGSHPIKNDKRIAINYNYKI